MTSNNCWDVLDTYFEKGGSLESSNPLVKHQIDSYNKFSEHTLGQIINGFNPIKVKLTNPKNDTPPPDNTYNVSINILEPTITKPSYQLPDGTQNIMTPYIARMNNMSYSSGVYVNVHVITEVTYKNGMTEKFDKTVNGIYIGKIPVMVRSKLCVLKQMQGICEENNNECIYDTGGYFIINGNEKVLISQDRINENKTLVFHPNNNSEGLYAEIRSMCDSTYLPPKTTSFNMSGKLNHMGRIIRINTSFIRSEVPIFVIFRALGIISDKEIIHHIIYDTEQEKNQRIINELMACCEDSCDIKTQEDAENVLIKIMIGSNKNNEHSVNRTLLQNNLRNDFLPHVGKNYRRKALYIGYVIRKMIRIYLGYDNYDNRDSYINKRVDTPGVLMSNLFRQCYGKMTKELKVAIEKELNLWRGNTNTPIANIISDISIHRFFKQSLLESWIKYSLSTGNWGIKSIGSFQNIKQGVSQVLNRMSQASTLSHLRRINTAMEKNGKLVQPRKLDNSQIGMICPAETPEGSSVGLVKNMALSTNISIAMNSVHTRNVIIELGVVVYDDSYNSNSSDKYAIDFLKNMGNKYNVYVMINGDIIGYHNNPDELYRKLKHYKRSGFIHPMTSIAWNIQKSNIIISTEAGRMYRPLYIVDYDPILKRRVLRIDRILKRKNVTWEEFINDKHFDYFITPNENTKYPDDTESYLDEEGFIEYLDCDEVNHSMIATFPVDLEQSIKGTALPPCYTHCEIHPSLMNGILGVNIPFSDHNQSPRNCYQCINQMEKVYLSNGNFKHIKDVVVGDKVVCFNPETMETENTFVVAHYNRVTDKKVYNITTVSGRTLIATYDHKFMTDKGWEISENFNSSNTKLGIYIKSYHSRANLIKFAICENMVDLSKYNYGNNRNIYKYLGLYPLNNDNDNINLIARIAGCYINIKKGKNMEKNINDYIRDISQIGFKKHNIYDTNYIIFMEHLCDDISWINKCSNITMLNFASSYLSCKCSNIKALNDYIESILTNNANNKIENIVKDVLKFNFITDINDIYNISNYYERIGCCYNKELHIELAINNEYNLYKNYFNDINKTLEYKNIDSWKQTVYVKGDLLFVPFHFRSINNNNKISDITVNSANHSFIGGNSFAISNCAMGKQALGIYSSNFNKRIDTMGNILNYPQKSLVSTKLSKYTMADKLPSGVNAIVAIMTHTGFNQEDSIMVNQSALDRGLFTSTYYKAIRDVCNKNHSTGEEEIFTNPVNKSEQKPYSYEKLGEDGFVKKNTHITGNDIIVGKVMPKKINGEITYVDNSITMKSNDDGYIDMNYNGINSEGYKFCKVRIRKNRKPEIGDKCASCSAQKGTIGMTYKHQDMPYTKDGIVPDIIMNPHAIPSRMTIAQLMESIMGKASCHIGAFGDSTPYNDCSVEDIAKVLEKSGMERYGNEIMYNGRTGEQIRTEIFIGPTYYQRLKHMVSDKVHSRGSNGPIVMLTRQPSEGRARSGGLRLGEMERDCFIAHGTANFLAERMLHVSDNYRVFICKTCGLHANVNTEKNIYNCKYCKNNTDIAQVRIPYAFKLLSQELYTMNVMMRYVCN